MRSYLGIASVAALVVSISAFTHGSKAEKSSWKFKSGRALQTDPCLHAIQSVLGCTGDWSGGSEPPLTCCGPMSEVFAQCGDGTVFPTVVRVLNEADMTFGPNATLPIMSLVGFCPRPNVTAAGCAEAISAAQSCGPSPSCCSHTRTQIEACLGVPNATENGFWDMLVNQTAPSHCPVFSVDLCQASLHRLSRCGEANGWNPSACCHYSDFARQFCHNLEAYVESTFAGQVSMYLNASLSAPACKRHHNDGCMHAVRQLQSCANMYSGMPTGTGATPCCGSLYHVQSQCGNGDIFDTVQFLLELPFVELDVYSFGNMMDVVGRCPQGNSTCDHCINRDNALHSCLSSPPAAGNGTSPCCPLFREDIHACLGHLGAHDDGYWKRIGHLADNSSCKPFTHQTCANNLLAIDRCFQNNHTMWTGACCGLGGMVETICAGYQMTDYSSIPLSPGFWETANFYFEVAGYCGGHEGGCHHNGIIHGVFKYGSSYVTTNYGDSAGGSIAYFANSGQPFYWLDTSRYHDIHNWAPMYECSSMVPY